MGSRYGGLKQVDKITDSGEIILDFSLYDAMMAGFERAVFVIKEEHRELFREVVDERAGRFMEIEYAYQKLDDVPDGVQIPEGREKPWGTGHAVLSCRDLVKGPFAVINADDYYGPSGFTAIYDYLTEHQDGEKYSYCMVGYQLANTVTENSIASDSTSAKILPVRFIIRNSFPVADIFVPHVLLNAAEEQTASRFMSQPDTVDNKWCARGYALGFSPALCSRAEPGPCVMLTHNEANLRGMRRTSICKSVRFRSAYNTTLRPCVQPFPAAFFLYWRLSSAVFPIYPAPAAARTPAGRAWSSPARDGTA